MFIINVGNDDRSDYDMAVGGRFRTTFSSFWGIIVSLLAKAECFAHLCHRLGVCLSVRLSVCLSVTLVICIKTVQASITKSSLWAAPRSLVCHDKISCHWVQGFSSNKGVEEGYPLKRRHFAVIGSNNVKTVADRYIHAAYHNKHWWQAFWIYQHQWPWTTLNPSKRGF